MGARGFSEMGIELLDKDRLGLSKEEWLASVKSALGCYNVLTLTLSLHRVVRLPILEPDTPGGFNVSMACKPASRSATADDMLAMEDP